MYPECFDPNDKYWRDYEYDIKVDPAVEPKVHPPRRVPLELKSKLKVKLDRMEKGNTIIKVNTPTKWVSSLLLKEKPNGELRVCLDPTDLNKAIMRDHQPFPVLYTGRTVVELHDRSNGHHRCFKEILKNSNH